MKTRKTTKRALLLSVCSIALCLVMLMGTTFAWFTDTASTAVNTITSGTLDVALEMLVNDEWVSAEGKTLSFIKAQGTDEILWEPGCTYVLPKLRVVNNGSLALKYKLQVNGIDGSAKLNEAIEWTMTLNGDTLKLGTDRSLAAKNGDVVAYDELTVSGHMKEEAGNEYQGLTINGIGLTVYATQDTVEYDSTTNEYDKNAQYDSGEFYYVDSVDTLKAAAANMKKGDVLQLADDLTLSETVRFSASGIVVDGNGHTITADMNDTDVANLKTLLSFGYDTTYCTGVTVKNLNFAGKGGRAMHFHGGTSSVLENVKISGEWSLAINFYGTHGAVMNNCDISSTYADKYAKATIFANEQSANQIILNNTKIDSLFVNATEKGATYANDGIKVVVNDGSEITELHTNTGITRTFHQVNGTGKVGALLDDVA